MKMISPSENGASQVASSFALHSLLLLYRRIVRLVECRNLQSVKVYDIFVGGYLAPGFRYRDCQIAGACLVIYAMIHRK